MDLRSGLCLLPRPPMFWGCFVEACFFFCTNSKRWFCFAERQIGKKCEPMSPITSFFIEGFHSDVPMNIKSSKG